MQNATSAIAAAAPIVWVTAGPARAAVLDATYRGTMVCDKLPFSKAKHREAITVTIADGTMRYSHVVRLGDVPEAGAEQGTGTLAGQRGSHRYEAKYSGTFVRRSARLKGTQTWTEGTGTVTRACAGVIKRPLKAFLPRKKR
jgi:hypothetical protein